MNRIPFIEMKNEFKRVLLKYDFSEERAELCARLFTETSCDGVYSHGLNRFPLFVKYLQKGYVRGNEKPVLISEIGSMERWDGKFGTGNLNAHFCMERAIHLAHQHGMGCSVLRNTNHWMRAGTYGWQAAEAGCIGICWTNTMPNTPPWGSKEKKVGNNPLVMAVPRAEGHIVLDFAMSQFSYGQLESYSTKGEVLPVAGGFDQEGNITRDPSAILASERPLPIGYWKGSSLSLMLDLIAMMLSGGQGTYEIGSNGSETGISQVFIAFDLKKLPDWHLLNLKIEEIVADLHTAIPDEKGEGVRYPGERTLRVRAENLERGIPVDPTLWNQVLTM
ncbi:2,3-diketo-L-gulonate reductase [Paenibacillus sp. A3]|uniref:3-dehydro-L-gulonate 2-dehydrogenase n=1 Tax=Paenibacillus sp. A3 TaxID=1337054 RepID=UPI0006D5AF91|nr:3-dehydro-L-gulonate 2-dehydrogenase [Paenibacillus sp. A3]KPV57588.1 2,3-diketo-L-gulonate reductase [Paenibacillus sp. A3]